ncbi:MAG TPA: DivIVA domain-containing protein, partial [Nitrospirae bacterium]|nr:DivIVA domain-containing protein [Nitrospirota bacterium]
KEYKNIETTLKDTLISTQQMAEQFRATAKKEADLLRKEAEMKAEEILRDAQDKVVKVHEDIIDLKGVRRHFKEELRRLIESHLSMMEFDKEREEEIPDEV